MTRALIIGSSHVGAYRNAHDTFGSLCSDLTIEYFAMRGPLFLMGKLDGTGIFTPHFRNDDDRALVTETNGQEVVDTTEYDQLLMVGHRFAFNSIAALLSEHDILEGARTGRARLISTEMVKETIQVVTQASVKEAVDAIRDCGRAASFAMAPYPASSIVERGDDYPLAHTLRLFWEHPDAHLVFDLWIEEVERALRAEGHRLLRQPATLCDGPFATKSQFATRASDATGGTLANIDHRHMNADFGLAMLCEYAENHLGLVSGIREQTAPTERIA
ncbi:hypothetical protein Z946_2705 [Sulfitobacter noctilucicola]|uniref:Uncharacterized protein n=1 Tax=Sulfitobacter noctilucicola TaxID=1342301 RepID=A0A7W6M9C7_9RHOB|nr:hypothetical protein [Sulfitobacter noctilucicola]KIN63831.1 hypothetical protein Z946_2705 [Sulfitobacter noctilucicola]MBB4174661.1 hypothetical protein [Sulfitobacter noctilucicola]